MNILIQRTAGAVLALAVLPFAAGAANAAALHLKVGDLSQPEQAQEFNRRVDDAGKTMCAAEIRDLATPAAQASCRQAVRDEVMDELTRDQRSALDAAIRQASTANP